MSTTIDTVIVIHVPSEWRTTNRRWAFRALAETLPKHAAVLCVNRPLDLAVTPLKRPMKFWRDIWSSRLEMENERFGVLSPRLLVHEILARRIPGARLSNRRLMASQLGKAIRRVYPSARRFIQWIHYPNQHWVFGAIPGCGKIYHAYDEHSYTADGVFQPRRWERELTVLKDAELVFATASAIQQRRAPHTRRIELLPNGMPSFFLEDAVITDDPIDRIPRPRIGYLGHVFSLLDFAMLETIFARRREWQLVFVGPIQSDEDVRGLRALPNVHFLGRRPHESLPSILARFDVGLIPITINDFTRPLTPLKFFEYLGAGVPMVSTCFDELEQFRDLIRLVPNEPEAFEAAIEQTLNDDRAALSARLRQEARSHTWTVINRERVVPLLREVFDF